MSDCVYIDNAATTWPKPEAVYRAVDSAMREHGANPGRGSYSMSVDAQSIVDDARLEVSRLFNAPDPGRVIFTLNCTDALCIALNGLIKPGDRILSGPYEHNSVVRPLHSLARAGARIEVIRPTPIFGLDLDHFVELCATPFRAVVLSHVANVTGALAPVPDVARIAHARGGLVILDAAQSAGSLDIDMQALGIDLLAAPGHKGLYGPMGTGVLVLAAPIALDPLREGGTGFQSESPEQPAEYPWRLEAGTVNLPGIAGLAEGIRYVRKARVQAIGEREADLARTVVGGLRQIDGVRVFSGPACAHSGVVSFLLPGMDAAVTATILDTWFGIAVRSGLHCAPSAHRILGTLPGGTVRASFGAFNTPADAQALVHAVAEIASSRPTLNAVPAAARR